MKHYIYVPPNSHPTITSRFSINELNFYDIFISDTPDEATIIVASLAEHLAPFVNTFGSHKRYLLWCDEPLWSYTFQKFDARRVYVSSLALSENFISVDIMNCFTGDVFFSNYHFLNSSYHLSFQNLNLVSKRKFFHDSIPPKDRKIAAFLTYRNEGKWNYEHSSGIKSLNNLRTRVALEGKLFDKVDVFGQGWPLGMSQKENRFGTEDKDQFEIKLDYYKNYHFAWCVENTWVPFYVSEKIWHSIIAGCLPIYYAGPEHTIYQDFPPNSFIDYFNFKDPVELFEYIEHISEAEFNARMLLCLQTLQNALLVSDEGRSTLQMQLKFFADRLDNIEREIKIKPIAIKNLFPSPDWKSILGNGHLTILDIGANDGGTSAQFSNWFPDAKIFSFEPDQRPITRFKQNFAHLLQDRISLFEGVISDINGEIDFFMSDGKGQNLNWYESGWDLSGSIKKPLEHLIENPDVTFPKSIRVKSITLDSWSEKSNVKHADLIWVDVQGAELNVIRGGKKLLRQTRFLYMEYADKELYEGQASVQELTAELPEFEVVQVYAGDVLFRNRILK